MTVNRRTRTHCTAVGSRLGDECHPARGSGVEADGLALAASLHEWCRRAPAQGQGQGRARRQEGAQCRSTARDRNADSKEKAQASNALERADADFFGELWIDGER